jgi:hypothetical protein
VKLVAVLLALAAVVAALLYPFSRSEHRQSVLALGEPHGPLQGGQAADGAREGVASYPSPCAEPVYLRVRNLSSLDFDSVQADGMDFGPLPAGAQSEYRKDADCGQRLATIRVMSSRGPMAPVPYDLSGETPAEAGYYTRALSLAPNNAVTSQLTRDAPPN